jgi:FkbM family methyltransferase
MKKVLLDCGSHFGKGLKKQIEINNIDSSWKVYAWEANPYTYQVFLENPRFKHLDLTAYHAAVSNENGKVKFNVQKSTDKDGNDARSGTGSSIVSLDEWRPAGSKPFVEEVEVPTINLSEWLVQNLSENDYVILKMDIEGAEYDTLEKIITDGRLKFINKLYIEWHSTMFSEPEKYKTREDKIIEEFKKFNIPVEPW